MLFVLALLLAASIPSWAQDAAPSGDYVLGNEDVVSITVLRHPEFSSEYYVPTSGTIQVVAVGEVRAAGMSLTDLQKHVHHKLRDRLRNPEVTVSLKSARMRRIYVYGDVKSPGIFDLKQNWSVAEGLSAAGGLNEGVPSRDVTVTIERAGGGVNRLPLDLALSGEKKEATKLQPGDVLRFQSVVMVPVYVSGQVRTPGMFRLREDSSGLLEAISQAGGLTANAATTMIKIVRISGEEQIVDLSRVLATETTGANPDEVAKIRATMPKLGAGDIVLVPESLDRFAILGNVGKPGFYSIPSGRTYTLSEAVAVAEGASARGRLSRIGLVREENGKRVQRVYDLGKFLKTGDAKENPTVLPGDILYIPETNRTDIGTVLNGISTTAILFNVLKR